MTGVLDALEAEPPPRRACYARWVTQEPVLACTTAAGLRDLLLDDTPPVDYERRDDLLAALIRLSHTDKQAGTLLVACLLPGLRAKLKQHGWGLDREEADSIALEALWRRIASYPLLRRPRKIAMNLLLDTTHDLITARDKELAYRTNTNHTDRDIQDPVDHTGDVTPEVLWAATRRAGVLNDKEIALLRATRVRDIPIDQVAPLLEMSLEAARKARQRAVHKLRAWWDTDRHVA